MNKALLGAIIGVLVVVGLVVGIIMYLQSQTSTSSPSPSTSGPSESGSNTGTSSQPQQGNVSAEIKNFAFVPSKITIKKGTTVTWTNQDSPKHNVVATNSSNSGGLPTDSPLLAKGESFSHTFNEVGMFTYKCAPHPNMTGTVEVVE